MSLHVHFWGASRRVSGAAFVCDSYRPHSVVPTDGCQKSALSSHLQRGTAGLMFRLEQLERLTSTPCFIGSRLNPTSSGTNIPECVNGLLSHIFFCTPIQGASLAEVDLEHNLLAPPGEKVSGIIDILGLQGQNPKMCFLCVTKDGRKCVFNGGAKDACVVHVTSHEGSKAG